MFLWLEQEKPPRFYAVVASHRSWIGENEDDEEVDVMDPPKQHSRATPGGINFRGATAFLDCYLHISLTMVFL